MVFTWALLQPLMAPQQRRQAPKPPQVPLTPMQQLYKSQQKRLVEGYTPNFKNKRDEIQQQYHKFWAEPSAKADVTAYLNNTPHHVYDTPGSFPKWIKANNVLVDPTGPEDRIQAEDKYCWILGNVASFDVAQYPSDPGTASMSFIHLLAVPKARLYNGVSLNPDNVRILDYMINFFRIQWRDPKVRDKMIEHQKRAIDEIAKKSHNPEGYHAAMDHFQNLKARIDNLREDDFQFGLHLHPDHSLGQLHMHIIAMPYEMRKYSTTEHDKKTKDALEVRDFILSRSKL